VSQCFDERLVAQVLGRLPIAHQTNEIAKYRLVMVMIELFNRGGRYECLFDYGISFAGVRTAGQAFILPDRLPQ
jgi:hypothetical protein